MSHRILIILCGWLLTMGAATAAPSPQRRPLAAPPASPALAPAVGTGEISSAGGASTDDVDSSVWDPTAKKLSILLSELLTNGDLTEAITCVREELPVLGVAPMAQRLQVGGVCVCMCVRESE